MSKIFLGIDISKNSFDVALLLLDNKTKTKKFSNNINGFKLLEAWLKLHNANNLHACMEATGIYGELLANFLYQSNISISIVNPTKIKGFGTSMLTRTKTDKSDAKLIAHFCKAMSPPTWQPTSQDHKELQYLCRRLEDLQKILRQEYNHLEASSSISVKKSINTVVKCLETQIEEIKQSIKEKINQDPELRNKKSLLETIPGIGEATIMQVLSFINVNDFKSVRQLCAFIGLNPKQRQSGTSVNGRSRISKVGNSSLRKTLYFPAISAKKYNPILKVFCELLKAAGKPPMVIICAVMRKLIHIIYGVLKSGKAFDVALAKI